MYRVLIAFIWTIVLPLASCTDLAAIYKKSLLLLRDADKIQPASPLRWSDLTLRLPESLSYPVGLTHDPKNNRLFLSDALHYDGRIFSLSLGKEREVTDVHVVVEESDSAVIEGLTYDPRKDQLYWTDTTAHNVYKIPVATDLDDHVSRPESVHDFGDIVQPRGVAVDYCKEVMYWSERGGSGNLRSSIKMCDINGTRQSVVRQGNSEDNIYYQGLTYDVTSGRIIWAETTGDNKSTSSCRIVSSDFSSGTDENQVLLTMEHCYPFSLTSDGKYVYWADWSQNGIMRASLSDLDDIVKLVHTPDVDGYTTTHHGAYGITTLKEFEEHSVEELCKGITQNGNLQLDTGTDYSSKTGENEADDRDTKTVYDVEGDKEETTALPVEIFNARGEIVYNYNNEDHSSKISKESTRENYETIDNIKENIVNEEPTVKTLDVTSSGESQQKYSLEYFRTQIYSEKQLYIIVIIVLAVCCILFCSTTLGLSLKIYFLRRNPPIEELPTRAPPLPSKGTPVKHPRQPKRFGPPKKSGFTAVSTCSKQPCEDGVHINIEDCCQMTLCETPCYTSVKKEGRGYTAGNKEDKTGLLDNCDF